MIQIGDSVEINIANDNTVHGKIILFDSNYIVVKKSNLEILIPLQNVLSIIKEHHNGD